MSSDATASMMRAGGASIGCDSCTSWNPNDGMNGGLRAEVRVLDSETMPSAFIAAPEGGKARS